MAKTRYAPDRGLTARMTLTMFLLGLVFVAFITVLVLVLSATSTRSGSGGIVFFAVLLGLVLGVGSFFYSDKIALSTARAQRGHARRTARRRPGCTASWTGSARWPTCPSRGWPSRRPRC